MTIVRKGDGNSYLPTGHDEEVFAKKIFNPSNGCDDYDVHVTTFAPGCGMEEEVHPYSDHVFYVTEGEFEIRSDGNLVATLGEGDAIRIPAGEKHQIVNVGDVDSVFFALTIPPAV